MAYIVTDGAGTYLKLDYEKRRYVPTQNQLLAATWGTEKKAEGCRMTLKSDVRSHFWVTRIGEEDEKGELLKPQKSLENKDIGVNDTDAAFNDFTEKIKKESENLKGQLSNSDKEIVDIEHYIEFKNMDVYHGWRAFKMLQEHLRKRRKIKNRMEIINVVRADRFTTDPTKKVEKKILEQSSRTYTPRVMTELFKEGDA